MEKLPRSSNSLVQTGMQKQRIKTIEEAAVERSGTKLQSQMQSLDLAFTLQGTKCEDVSSGFRSRSEARRWSLLASRERCPPRREALAAKGN